MVSSVSINGGVGCREGHHGAEASAVRLDVCGSRRALGGGPGAKGAQSLAQTRRPTRGGKEGGICVSDVLSLTLQ